MAVPFAEGLDEEADPDAVMAENNFENLYG